MLFLEILVQLRSSILVFPLQIDTCNSFYCDQFKPISPNKPKIWTENWPGWYDFTFSISLFWMYKLTGIYVFFNRMCVYIYCAIKILLIFSFLRLPSHSIFSIQKMCFSIIFGEKASCWWVLGLSERQWWSLVNAEIKKNINLSGSRHLGPEILTGLQKMLLIPWLVFSKKEEACRIITWYPIIFCNLSSAISKSFSYFSLI